MLLVVCYFYQLLYLIQKLNEVDTGLYKITLSYRDPFLNKLPLWKEPLMEFCY